VLGCATYYPVVESIESMRHLSPNNPEFHFSSSE